MKRIGWRPATVMLVMGIAVTSCGGGGGGGDDEPAPSPPPPSTYSVGGAVTGLNGGSPVVLRNNGGDALTVSSSGEFAFASVVAQGSGYSVTVATQPASKICTVSYGSGTIGSGAVDNVAVSCISSPGAVDPDGTNTLSSTHKPTLVGIVIDSPVINLSYDGIGALDGATNTSGQFNYQPGEQIIFKVGDIELPPVVGQPVITLFNFAGSNDINNTVLVNIARFLQSLDSDGNPDNGITISEQAHTAATGLTLDFGSASFDADANPIIAAAGGANTALVSGSTAITHVQSTLDNMPKQVAIAGAWTTGAGTNMRALILLENGWYYGVENCSGQLGYERGAWAYSGSTLTLAVSDNADGSCGLDTGSHAATLTGNSLTLDGATWADVSYSTFGLSGLYVREGFITSNNHEFTLIKDTEYILLELFDDSGQASGEIGTYTWGGNSVPAATFTPLIAFGTPDGGSGSYNIQRFDSFLTVDDGTVVSMDVAVRPAKVATSLPGFWYLDEAGSIASTEFAFPLIFTPSGKFMYLGNDATCPGRVNGVGSGEIGTYAWDALTNAFSWSIIGDSNGDCGVAVDGANVSSAVVTGNLLTFSDGGGVPGVSIKPSSITVDPAQNAAVGFWKQTAGSGALTLMISQVNTSTLTIRAIDNDCAQTGTAYAAESVNATVSAPNNIVQAAASTNYDTAACGLPTVLGPTYSIVGDTLSIDGVGTFIRQ